MSCHRRILSGRRDLLAPAAAFPERYPCLLESVVHGTAQSRFDILLAFPRDRLTLHSDGRLSDDKGDLGPGRFLDALDARSQSERLPAEDDEIPFHGGWALWLGYELAGEVEPRLALASSSVVPVAVAVRCPSAIVIDHARKCTILVAEADCPELLDQLESDLSVTPIDPAAAGSRRVRRGATRTVSRWRGSHP